ncbi:MAG: MIP family channel protein [Deltaproteobacteria bacterium]|jgi:MIP family channel proteins|nr:MIP family channel protein [Deltaproteobacteria bacterium]
MISRREFLGELGGTFLLVFLGVGTVHSAVLTGNQSGVWQVAVVWFIAVAVAIYIFGAASGAHINPAMTVAFMVWRGFPPKKAFFYVLAQLIGAIVAAILLYLHFKGMLEHFEAAAGIVRGQPGSELSAMTFGEYFPHPGLQKSFGWANSVSTTFNAMAAEFVGTAILAAVVFSVTDPKNPGGPGGLLAPVFIGFTVAAIISVLAPFTQVGLNPARDFGPRLVAYFLGWGQIAIPGPSGGFFSVYILAPCLGAVFGAWLYAFMTQYGEVEEKIETIRSAKMSKPKLLIVGGFLGAGKTTLLGQARKELESRGLKVGLITNDQAPGLVDTVWLGGQPEVIELTGSCFCCNFAGFEKSLEALTQWGAEIILAEPVGSCVDLSATVIQPLKDLDGDKYAVKPFSVVLDPGRAYEALGIKKTLLHKDALYILEKQLAEADLIVLNKTDLLKDEEKAELVAKLGQKYPKAKVTALSAKAGDGVKAWVEGLLATSDQPGSHLIDVDYDQYANGEAVLGWLNLTADADFKSRGGARALTAFLDGLKAELQKAKMEIGHVKVLWPGPEGFFIGNLIDSARPPIVTKARDEAKPGPILVNARVESEPDDLEKLVRRVLGDASQTSGLSVAVKDVYCLKPGRPNPTHRYAQVV